MSLNRRHFLKASAAISAASFSVLGFISDSFAQTYDLSKLREEGSLKDLTVGDENAPVVIVEYASLTCSHCSAFKTKIYPSIKEKYIDTGKVFFIPREFALNAVDTAAFMMGRALQPDKYLQYLEVMYAKQRDWAFTDDPYSALLKMAKGFGFTQKSFENAITDQKILNGLIAQRERAFKEFGVDATPTYFFNGNKQLGIGSLEDFEKLIEQAL